MWGLIELFYFHREGEGWNLVRDCCPFGFPAQEK